MSHDVAVNQGHGRFVGQRGFFEQSRGLGSLSSGRESKLDGHSFPERPARREPISTQSPDFALLRATGAPFVDKTSAIADLLCGRHPRTFRAIFSRPRRFGKVSGLPWIDPSCLI